MCVSECTHTNGHYSYPYPFLRARDPATNASGFCFPISETPKHPKHPTTHSTRSQTRLYPRLRPGCAEPSMRVNKSLPFWIITSESRQLSLTLMQQSVLKLLELNSLTTLSNSTRPENRCNTFKSKSRRVDERYLKWI